MGVVRIPPDEARIAAGKVRGARDCLNEVRTELYRGLNELKPHWTDKTHSDYADKFQKRLNLLTKQTELLKEINDWLLRIARAGEDAAEKMRPLTK